MSWLDRIRIFYGGGGGTTTTSSFRSGNRRKQWRTGFGRCGGCNAAGLGNPSSQERLIDLVKEHRASGVCAGCFFLSGEPHQISDH